MGRSRESLKRKKSSESKDSGYYTKRRYNYASSHTSDLSQGDRSSQGITKGSLQSCYDLMTYSQVPYHSWLTYFYDQEYNENSTTVVKINAFIEFFFKHPATSYDVESGLNFDVNLCIDDCALREKWPNFIEDIKVNPHHTLNCISAAFFEVSMQRAANEDRGNIERMLRILRINRINLLNYECLNPLPCAKLSSHGKLISMNGGIVAVGPAKRSLDSIVFACKCKRQLLFKLKSKTLPIPRRCNVCGNARYKRLLDAPYQLTKICQNIYVEDCHTISDEETISPKIINVRLHSSSVDKFMIGDKIRIVGIPRVILDDVKSSTLGSHRLYVDAKSVFKDDDTSNANLGINLRFIEQIKSEPDILNLLVSSLCPSVQGHEIIKAALVLGLFADKPKNDEIHDCMHILIIGNSGLGKSQLLRGCAQVSPEGTYIRGSSTISLSSTITAAVREKYTEDYRFEAGALALADPGLLCLDEIDKMSSQHQIIYNAMLRQRVDTINGELTASLPFRTSIFAMTNPTKKCYDPSKTVLANVNMSKQLLDRFHLIFVMRDHSDAYLDKLMCDRVLQNHGRSTSLTQQTESSVCNVDLTLRERLVTSTTYKSSDLLPARIFRMYINYTRLYVKPILSEASKIIIKRFCLLRYRQQRNFIEKLVRQTLVTLTEARAKVDARDQTSEQDVFDAIEIIEQSMFVDVKDFSEPRSNNSANKLTANKVKQFLEDLGKEAFQRNKVIFTMEELQNIAEQNNMTKITFPSLLSKLNEQGYLLKISSNSYKVVFL